MRRRHGALDVAAWLAWLEIPTRKRGVEHWARCPLHKELEPSMQIRDDGDESAGLWRCFGCGEHGNAVQLTARMIGVSHDMAREMMQERGFFGAPLPTPMRLIVEASDPRRERFALPQGVCFAPLEQWTTPARRYAVQRGITPAQVARWCIGYGEYGKLAGRLVIPVHDAAGVLRGYSARTFIDDEKRYLEPSTADGYVEGYVWGEAWWPRQEDRDLVIVCEGSLNGLAIERVLPLAFADGANALPSVCAVRGSHLAAGHVLRIGTFSRVLVASDPDRGGEKLWRALRGALARSARLRRVQLPQGLDANALERKDPSTLAAALLDAVLT